MNPYFQTMFFPTTKVAISLPISIEIILSMKQSTPFEGFVSISPNQSNKLVLDMSGCIHLGNLILFETNHGPNQLFKIVKAQYGQVYFKLKSTNKVLTIKDDSQDDGAHIIQEEFSNKPSQKFRMQEISPQTGEYIIYSFCGKVLDVCECKIKKESIVFQYAFNGGDNQLWKIKS